MDELVIDNLVYIPSKKAAAITGYAKDYVGQLCREGRIEAKLVGRSWYVLESSVREHRFGKPATSVAPTPASPGPQEDTAHEAPVAEEPPLEKEVPASPPLLTEVWESPTYTAEPVEEVFPDHPTYLTNTTENTPSLANSPTQIEEVQNAWQEWFSKNEIPSQTVPKAELAEPISISKEESKNLEADEADEKPEVIEVQINRTYPQPIRSMDIMDEDFQRRDTAQRTVRGTNNMNKRRAEPTKFRRKGNIALKAVFVAIIILTVAVTVIGTGSLSAINPSWAGNSSAVDFLAGVKSIEK